MTPAWKKGVATSVLPAETATYHAQKNNGGAGYLRQDQLTMTKPSVKGFPGDLGEWIPNGSSWRRLARVMLSGTTSTQCIPASSPSFRFSLVCFQMPCCRTQLLCHVEVCGCKHMTSFARAFERFNPKTNCSSKSAICIDRVVSHYYTLCEAIK